MTTKIKLTRIDTTMLKHSCIINIVPRLSLLCPHPSPSPCCRGEAKVRKSLRSRLMHHTELPSDHVIDFNQLQSKRNYG